MLGLSEFKLGIAIINMHGSDFQKAFNTAKLLHAYDIPCVVVLDKDAQRCADDLRKAQAASLPNIRQVYCLSKGTIEDYYPLEIVAEIINRELSPAPKVTAADFDATKHGKARLENLKKVMHEHQAGNSIAYLKRVLGGSGTRLMQEQGLPVDLELAAVFTAVKAIVDEQ